MTPIELQTIIVSILPVVVAIIYTVKTAEKHKKETDELKKKLSLLQTKYEELYKQEQAQAKSLKEFKQAYFNQKHEISQLKDTIIALKNTINGQ